MVHELHRLLPTLVFEQDDGPFAFLFEVEADFCADPFLGPFDHLPEHALAGLKLENLHVETTAVKAELEHSADLAFPLRIVRPPGGKAFTLGQCLIDFIQRRRFDSDFVQYIYLIFPYLHYLWLIARRVNRLFCLIIRRTSGHILDSRFQTAVTIRVWPSSADKKLGVPGAYRLHSIPLR